MPLISVSDSDLQSLRDVLKQGKRKPVRDRRDRASRVPMSYKPVASDLRRAFVTLVTGAVNATYSVRLPEDEEDLATGLTPVDRDFDTNTPESDYSPRAEGDWVFVAIDDSTDPPTVQLHADEKILKEVCDEEGGGGGSGLSHPQILARGLGA